jgi:hypothetical protein
MERLLEKRVINADGCWVWTGTQMKGNRDFPYGAMSIGNKPHLTHRVAYEMWVGPIPDDCEIDHVYLRGCRSTLCFNPAHLEAVTHRENLLRGVGVAATNAQKTHCLRGHPFDEANTYYPRAGGRSCRACRAMRNKNAYHAAKQDQR